MAKGISVEVDNLARKVTKGCVGVEDLARKIKKGYIGVGGVARPFFSSEKKVMRYGNATALTRTATVAGASVGNYALFGGGLKSKGTTYYNTVNAYDSNLVKTSPTTLSKSCTPTGGHTSDNKHALFAGGWADSAYNTIDVYTENLTRISADPLTNSTAPINGNVGDYIVFAGGSKGALSGYFNNVDAYDNNLVKTTASNLNCSATSDAASVGNYVLFGGGPTDYAVVTGYDVNLVKVSVTSLSRGRYDMFSGNVGKYAIFAGGQSKYYDSLSEVDVYDENLTRTTPFTMLLGRCRGVSASLKGFMLCAGGTTDNSDEYVRNTVEVYDENLVKSQIDGLSQARMDLGSATVGDYILFAGGYHYSSSTNYNIVDVYQVFE